MLGIATFAGNLHDSKILAPTLDQVAQCTGRWYERVLVDKGYRGHGLLGAWEMIMPGRKPHGRAYTLGRHKRLW